MAKINFKNSSSIRIHAIQIGTITAITFYGITQISQPSFALFTGQAHNEIKIQSAFIFPKTVKNLVDKAKEYNESAKKHYENILDLLKKLTNQKDAQKMKEIQQQILAESEKLIQDRGQVLRILSQLTNARNRALHEVDDAKKKLADAPGEPILKNNVQSAQHLLTYVEEGFKSVQILAYQAESNTKAASSLILKIPKQEN